MRQGRATSPIYDMKKIHGINVKMIAAVSRNRCIGNDGEIPWHIPADFAYFKAQTMGKAIIMGKTTYHSIGRFLPGRKNVVLTHDQNLLKQGSNFQSTLEGAVAEALLYSDDVVIIGGAQIYQAFLPYAHTVLLTEIDTLVDGDTFFPLLDNDIWRKSEGASDSQNGLRYRFVTYTRISE